MKNSIYAIIISTALFTASGTTFCSKPVENDNEKEIVSDRQTENSDTKKFKSVTVENIWKNMPSYDKYGNEITARARENMLQNALANKNNKKTEGNITEGIKVK